MSVLHKTISGFVADAIAQGDRPVSLAGDCCSAIGVLAGLKKAGINPVLVWLDAHGDFNTWSTTPSGFIGGMPLAMIVGRGEQTMTQAAGLSAFPQDRVILCDGRNLDPGEEMALRDSKISIVKDIDTLLDHPLIANPLYVHFDTDIINPVDAPAMSYSSPGGPRAVAVRVVCETIARTKNVVAVSFTTWSPALDGDGRSQAVCLDLLNVLIGG
jgi:arginase